MVPDVVGRFERELEALRKELAESSARSGRSTPTSFGDTISQVTSEEDLTMDAVPLMIGKDMGPASPEGLPIDLPDETKKNQ
jgi:hypothetical protein